MILNTKETKKAARTEVYKELRAGRIKKTEECEVCKSKRKLSAHHWHGYNPMNWLDIIWLCQQCHKWHDRCVKHNYEGTYKKHGYMKV